MRYLLLNISFFAAFLFGCQNYPPNNSNDTTVYKALITAAKNEKKTLADRYKSVWEAEAIAVKQKNVKYRIESLRMMGRLLLMMDSVDKAIPICWQLKMLAAGENDLENEGAALNNLAIIKNERSEFDSSIFFYKQANRLFKAIHDSVRAVQCEINMAIVYKNIGDFEKAFNNSVEAAKTMQTMDSKGDELAINYTTLGNILKDLRRYEDALKYHNEALLIRERLSDSIGIAGSLNNIGNVYKSRKQFEKALPFFLRSMEIKKRNGSSRSRAITGDNIAETLIALGKYDSAMIYTTQVMSLQNQNSDKPGWIATATQLATIYKAKNETNKALELCLTIEQLTNNPNFRRQRLDNAVLLEEIYSSFNRPGEALRYALIASSLKDSLFSADMATTVSNLEVRFRTEEQRQKLEQSDKDNKAKADQIKKQTYLIISLLAASMLLVVVVYLLFVSNRLRKKSKEKAELFMFELDHRVKNNLQIISGILNLQISESSTLEVSKALTAAKNRIQSIGILHTLLYQKGYSGEVNMDQFIEIIAQNISHAFGKKTEGTDCKVLPSGVLLKAGDAVLFGIIINELLTNIYKYASPINEVLAIEIGMKPLKNQSLLFISDNGIEWQQPHSRPDNKGLGLRLVYMLAGQIGAEVKFGRTNNRNNCSITLKNN